MNWKDLFIWGYATDIEEYDYEELETPVEEVNITITINLGEEENGNS